jgi:hypothetical protein
MIVKVPSTRLVTLWPKIWGTVSLIPVDKEKMVPIFYSTHFKPGLPGGIFSNKKPNLGKFWTALQLKMLVYFV